MTMQTIWAVLVSAACTLFMRALPFLFFRGNKPLPAWLERLGKVLPSAIMAVLVVYCLKDAVLAPRENALPQALGVAVVALSYRWKHNTLLSILLGTVAVMITMRLV
ncbi:MAG: AzlD domain-containing protein [Eubacteriales bacterium]|nr:AzlD domain-containing protein [Eubacteriales bacterium]